MTVHPGGMREMHWHPNADEWLYIIAGQGQAAVFNTGPKVMTQNFHPGDIGYVKKNFGHYLKNTGNTNLVYLEVFRSPYFADVSPWQGTGPATSNHHRRPIASIADRAGSRPAPFPRL